MTSVGVNGELATLAGCGGFPKYCNASADQHGVSGYILDVPNFDMKIVFEGDRTRCHSFHNFSSMSPTGNDCRHNPRETSS
jgi:acylphosphatase